MINIQEDSVHENKKSNLIETKQNRFLFRKHGMPFKMMTISILNTTKALWQFMKNIKGNIWCIYLFEKN